MQDLIRSRPGVLFTRVGYTRGDTPNATYRSHDSHAEAIEITYDPSATTYRELLGFFFQIHDPSTPEQRRVAEDTIADVDTCGLWPGKVVTEITPAGPFWEAEPEHQDYLLRCPHGYTCHFPRPAWVLPRRSDVASRPSSQLT